MIIEINHNNEIKSDILTFIDDSYSLMRKDKKGYVELQVVPHFYDDDPEIHTVNLNFSDNIFDRTGDYVPVSFNKEELKGLIDFLELQYGRFAV